jgi:hypothetical protein
MQPKIRPGEKEILLDAKFLSIFFLLQQLLHPIYESLCQINSCLHLIHSGQGNEGILIGMAHASDSVEKHWPILFKGDTLFIGWKLFVYRA